MRHQELLANGVISPSNGVFMRGKKSSPAAWLISVKPFSLRVSGISDDAHIFISNDLVQGDVILSLRWPGAVTQINVSLKGEIFHVWCKSNDVWATGFWNVWLRILANRYVLKGGFYQV